jgi:AraC family transcriptional regulator of adaptative response/methylated-DNA-[protein]-cysteine methyltransferase
MIEPDDLWWNAVKDRDATFDGALFYGVVTTGIYCRPGCPSRRPKRENVRFFADTASARRAGLRACKRCHPDAAVTGNVATRLVVGACDRLSHQDPLPAPAAFATLSGCSDRTLRRAFKDVLGVTPGQYLQALKAQRLRSALRNGALRGGALRGGALRGGARITDALYSAGYGSSGRAYENTARLGMRPSNYASGGAGLRIEYAVRKTAAGWLLAAASANGLCCVRFGESRAALRSTLTEEFPAASLNESSNEWIEALFDFADGLADWRVLPIDVRGTAFQEKVWQALREIPTGQTRTYAQVAQAIGLPSSVRAVANACGTNPVALAVPCHRVVPKAGGIGGYRWGAATKRALLEHEQVRCIGERVI